MALADYATPEDFRALETMMGLAGKLRYEELGEEQKELRGDLKRRNLTRTNLSKKEIRRVFKVRRVVDV